MHNSELDDERTDGEKYIEEESDTLHTDFAEDAGADSSESNHDADTTSPTAELEGGAAFSLRGMYRDWFLEYASYVILERAVPAIEDGLKPVQRRILHSMKTLDDGRFNKVANIVGNTMQYHPHGDASIKDALVQLGQKELLVETQGNWGNVLTGAEAAAGRYIEARLSPFALETLYSPKVTDWTLSYDGRKKEPVTLPTKFPILLFQGAEGIAVGLSSKILPHNFNDIIDGAVAHLRGEAFELYPDFITGGYIDVSRYNDGRRGGSLRIRSKIEKVDNKTLAVTEIPYGKTTGAVIDSILRAFEKGTIKIRKVVEQTTDTARIVIHLQPGTSSDKTIDALYAFTDCEVNVSPNCCVIQNEKPEFLGVSDLLRYSAERTREILKAELNIKLDEVNEQLMYASLEKFFIEKRIYKDKEYEEAADLDVAVNHIDRRLDPIKKNLIREVTRDDILKLLEIKMKRILRFNVFEADRQIDQLNEDIARLKDDLDHITDFTVKWFLDLKDKYGANYPRRTELRSFDNIEAAKVVEANAKLYFHKDEGFVGTGLKPEKDEQPIATCSSLDDIIIFYKDGRYKVTKVQDKLFVGKNVLHIAVFKPKDNRTIYNVIYQNGKGGAYYQKRFAIVGIVRDREYNVTQDRPESPVPGSKVVWFSANSNGEAEVVRVLLSPKQRLKTLHIDVDFSKLAIKSRTAQGNLVTRNDVHSIKLKERGVSTLGGRQVWFDHDVLRLNYDGRGEYLGEFGANDKILVIMKSGDYFTTNFDETNHYDAGIERILKFEPERVWTAVYDVPSTGYYYMKRYTFEPTVKPQRFVSEEADSRLIALSDAVLPRFELKFGGLDATRTPLEIDAAEFIGVKSFKAKGKRLTQLEVDNVVELEPREVEESEEEFHDTPDENIEEPEVLEPDRSDEEIRDELTGQQRLF
ncbi:MAG: DNA gyrase/topoisomerase IV subunit A [Muribaculaceae bacterium]|nr:DNA gyrase/topoisomerase IV subunit A [Muribaculaceae bacterium]